MPTCDAKGRAEGDYRKGLVLDIGITEGQLRHMPSTGTPSVMTAPPQA